LALSSISDPTAAAEGDIFISIINWNRTTAAKIWYHDFYNGMMKSYERLGWRLEGLKYVVNGCESVILGDIYSWSARQEERLQSGRSELWF
jgi:hypothetical protein